MSQSSSFFLKLLLVVLVMASLGDIKVRAEQEQFQVAITHPKEGNEVGRETVVKGTASIPNGHYLWVLARRSDFEPLWWPQREAKIDSKTREWQATAVFGGPQDVNWPFDVGVITVNAEGHKDLMEYWTKAMETGDWKPKRIQATTSPPKVVKVKKVRH